MADSSDGSTKPSGPGFRRTDSKKNARRPIKDEKRLVVPPSFAHRSSGARSYVPLTRASGESPRCGSGVDFDGSGRRIPPAATLWGPAGHLLISVSAFEEHYSRTPRTVKWYNILSI